MVTIDKARREAFQIFDKYNLYSDEQDELWSIIKDIVSNNNFLLRMDSNLYPHHERVSLGNHIISVATITYILGKYARDRKKPTISELSRFGISPTTLLLVLGNKSSIWKIRKIIKRDYLSKPFDLNTAVKIAMFHDLYELPWQNTNIPKSKMVNKHGFTHPIEAVINAYTWYPKMFGAKMESRKIIDGIIHHMHPFPVRCMDFVSSELNNYDKYKKLPDYIKKCIVKSSNRFSRGHISVARTRYPEGAIVGFADKYVSFSSDLITLNGLKSCITGSYNYDRINIGTRVLNTSKRVIRFFIGG